MLYKLGETKIEIQIETLEENKSTALSLASQARNSIDIFTQDLDAEIYNNPEFERSIFNLARKHANTRIQILVQDSTNSAKNGHCLIRLAQKLSSSIFIHKPSREYKDEQSSFMVVDKLGLIHRMTPGNRNYKASVNFMSPKRAGELSDYFNEIWEQSTPDIQTRRVYM